MGKQKALHTERSKEKMRRAESHVSTDGLPEFSRKTVFVNYAELAAVAKRSIFLIARFRQVDENETRVTTLGTGFLVGNGRMMTCSHVMNNQEAGHEPHQDGDLYMFLMRDENGHMHQSAPITLKMGETVFDYPAQDVSVIYLPRDFYFDAKGRMVHHPDDYLVLANNPRDIGADIGVLGYPMQAIGFTPEGSLDIGQVFIRGDRGIVNTRYANNGVFYYEFTVAFNPGNSGGPIFDIESGEVIAMVHAYRSVPIKFAKEPVPEELQGEFGATEVVSVVRSTYSLGLASQNYTKLAKEHGVCFGD